MAVGQQCGSHLCVARKRLPRRIGRLLPLLHICLGTASYLCNEPETVGQVKIECTGGAGDAGAANHVGVISTAIVLAHGAVAVPEHAHVPHHHAHIPQGVGKIESDEGPVDAELVLQLAPAARGDVVAGHGDGHGQAIVPILEKHLAPGAGVVVGEAPCGVVQVRRHRRSVKLNPAARLRIHAQPHWAAEEAVEPETPIRSGRLSSRSRTGCGTSDRSSLGRQSELGGLSPTLGLWAGRVGFRSNDRRLGQGARGRRCWRRSTRSRGGFVIVGCRRTGLGKRGATQSQQSRDRKHDGQRAQENSDARRCSSGHGRASPADHPDSWGSLAHLRRPSHHPQLLLSSSSYCQVTSWHFPYFQSSGRTLQQSWRPTID